MERVVAGWAVAERNSPSNPDCRLSCNSPVAGISGAELSWLSGKRPLEDFGYQQLIEWYPGKFPDTAKEIEIIHDFGSTKFIHALNYVCIPLGLDCLRSQGHPLLPPGIFKMMEDKFSDRSSSSQRLPKWMSAAFAPNMIAIRTALEWGLLDDAPGIDTEFYWRMAKEEKKTAKPDGKVWSELIHKITALCGKVLREKPTPSERGTAKPIIPTEIIEYEEPAIDA